MITYTKKVTLSELQESGRMAEKFFKMEEHPDQIAASEETLQQILNWCPHCCVIAYDCEEVVGSSFIFPTTQKLLEEFVAKKITEKELFLQSQKIASESKYDAIYLCSAVVVPKYRRKGIAMQAFCKALENISVRQGITMGAWAHTKAGEKLVKKIVRQYRSTLVMRK